jgi:hypothetical protein
MKKFLFIAIIGLVITSCGGGGSDDPTPPPVVENKAPSTPSLVDPTNNKLCINNAVTFQWNASTDPEGNPISYKVEVAKNNTFSPIADTKTATTTSTTISLEKGVAYYWRVTAIDSKNASSSPSSVFSFYTEGLGVSNYIPFSPELVAPNLGATVQTATATLQWNASDVDNDALTYDVYFGTAPSPTTVVSANQSAKSYTTTTLTASSTYYWKIVVKDGKGGQTTGQVWNFKTD